MAADPALLTTIPFFQTLDADERAAIAALMREETIAAGTTVFREADEGGMLYVIGRGKVELSVIGEDRRKVVVDTLSDGDFFGELSLLDGAGRSATAVAVEEVRAFCLARDPFLDLLRRRPEVALEVLAAFARRFRKTDELLRQRVRNPNEVMEDREAFADRVDDGVARFGRSWRFIFALGRFLLVWILINAVFVVSRAKGAPFDPYPSILLTRFLSMLAGIQAPVIMM